jgi:hypothetical protein
MAFAARSDQLAGDTTERVTGIAGMVARRHGRDEIKPANTGGGAEARLVVAQVSPEDCGEIPLEAKRRGAALTLVRGQREVQLPVTGPRSSVHLQ